jgi:hypothetical protein|tara:strand:- start:307 stop:543 length:237 start_codon:yes stop_codon:yes gene_type:complete
MSKEDKKQMITHEGKEYEFTMDELSLEAQAQYGRANELAGQLMRLEQQSNELRFLANNYVRFVIDELSDKEVDDKEKK